MSSHWFSPLSKFTDMLLAQGISQAVVDSQLTIIKGDIASVPATKSALLSDKDHTLASQIMSGVGAPPPAAMEPLGTRQHRQPRDLPTTTMNIVQALREIYTEYPSILPSIVVNSTTGVSDVYKGVPFGFQTLYHVALADPHKDKKAMEKIITENATGSDTVFRCAIAVCPSLLTGDQNIKGTKAGRV